jgi:hypothetical protein
MTMNRRGLPSRRALAVMALVATMLGSALVGVYSGGGFIDPLAEAATKAADASAVVADPEAVAGTPEQASASNRSATQRRGADILPELIRSGDWVSLSRLLPKGITQVHGMGGTGLQRQVKSHGIWFPVFDLSTARPIADGESDTQRFEPDSVKLNEIPLNITSASPPLIAVGQALAHTFTAVGGEPPYRWAMSPAQLSGFDLDAVTGAFTGSADEAQTRAYTLTVMDAGGSAASALGALVVTPTEALSILTTALPAAVVGEAFQSPVAATGGVPPYRWSMVSEHMNMDESTGIITGVLEEAGSFPLIVTVTDSQQQEAQRAVEISAISGLEIITASSLMPAAPGAEYELQFEAKGGAAPYQWTVLDGLPLGWSLSSEGLLSGRATASEATHRFDLRVADHEGQAYRKTFTLPIRDALIAVPSRNKVGLAWKPQEIAQALGSFTAVLIQRAGVEIYRGNGNQWIDRDLPDGVSITYHLSAILTDGSLAQFASTQVKVLPMQLARAVPGVSGDPFADRVVSFSPLSGGGYGVNHLPVNVLGPPDGRSTFSPANQPSHIASLHARSGMVGGSITLEFTNNIVESGQGLDFTVFENVFFVGNDPNNRFMEPAIIEVALFEDEWHRLPVRVNPPASAAIDFRQPAYYAAGFAGVNATTGDDPTDPARSGGDSFDLAQVANGTLLWIRYIRITATGDGALADAQGFPIRHTAENQALSGSGSSGFDLDAVSAANY